MIEVQFAVRAFAGFLCAFRVEFRASCGKNGKAPRVELVGAGDIAGGVFASYFFEQFRKERPRDVAAADAGRRFKERFAADQGKKGVPSVPKALYEKTSGLRMLRYEGKREALSVRRAERGKVRRSPRR